LEHFFYSMNVHCLHLRIFREVALFLTFVCQTF